MAGHLHTLPVRQDRLLDAPRRPPPKALSALCSPSSNAGRTLHLSGKRYIKWLRLRGWNPPPDSGPAFTTCYCVTYTRGSASLCLICDSNGNNKTTDIIGSGEPKTKYNVSANNALGSAGSNLSSATGRLCNLEQITYPLSTSVPSSMKWGKNESRGLH